MDCPCGNPDGTNNECERCRLIAKIGRLNALLDRVKGFANKMARSGSADRCRAGNDMLELFSIYDDESFIADPPYVSPEEQKRNDAMERGDYLRDREKDERADQ